MTTSTSANIAAAPRRPGRPTGSTTTERTATIPPVRCTPQQRERFDALGGADWLRAAIDRAKK